MFAEPASKTQVSEQLQLTCIDSNQTQTIIKHSQVGLAESSYHYTLRNLYYTQKLDAFTQQLFKNTCRECQFILVQKKSGDSLQTLLSYEKP